MNLLYLMNLDWNLIKQRPQFIAEGLSKTNNVTVLYQYRYSRKELQKRPINEINVKPVYVIPKGDKIPFLSNVNVSIWKEIVKRQVRKNNIEGIYIIYPTQFDYVRDYKGKIIYDCMDDYAAFREEGSSRESLINKEKELVERVELIICSSEKLKRIISGRYGKAAENKICVVRNGYDGKLLPEEQYRRNNNKKNGRFVFCYFGTISRRWFNFDYLLKSLDEFDGLEYRLYGPVSADISIPNSPGIKFMGIVEHEHLYENIKDAQCFIMPFIVNEVVKSVDPVKLYEYINFNKNILSVYYDEIERFDNFVYFYRDYEEYRNQIIRMMQATNVKYSIEQRNEFLSENTWENRTEHINNLLEII